MGKAPFRESPWDHPPVPPALVLGGAVLAFSWAGPLVRLTDAPALAVAAWRLLFSVAFVGLVLASRRTGSGWSRLSARGWLLAVGAGLLLAGHFWTWIASLRFTTVANSVVLVSTQPLFVGLLSLLFLGERPIRREWIGIAVAVVGAGLIGWGDVAVGGTALLGDALALMGAVLAAGYYVAGRSLRQTLDLWSYVGVVYGVAALALTGAVLASPEVPFTGYGPPDWAVFLALAAGPMMVGHTGLNYALRYMRAYLANLAVLGEPVGATLIAWLLPAIAERPSWETVVGGLLILSGVAVALGVLRPGRSRAPPGGESAPEKGQRRKPLPEAGVPSRDVPPEERR